MATANVRKSSGRAARSTIAESLRQRLVGGLWPPGSQLPTRPEIEREFDASPATVQHAFDILRRDGFVEVNGRQGGTYASRFPPHRFHYGMLFRAPVERPPFNRLFQSLVATAGQAAQLNREGARVDIFHGVEAHVDNLPLQQVVTRLRHHCLAGLIFPENPFSTGLAYSALAKLPVPRVALLGEPLAWCAAVRFESMIERALDYFGERGRCQVAVLTNHLDTRLVDSLRRELASRAMQMRPAWLQMAHLSGSEAAANIVHLLFERDRHVRPDALLITNDNLVEHAMSGIIAAGVRVPDDLEVVAHCNFPWLVPKVLPVRRLGYDARQVLAACLDLLDEQRQGNQPGCHSINPVFEEELA